MSSWLGDNKKALVQSFTVFALLFVALVLVAKYVDFSRVDMAGLLFLTAFLCCVFVAKNTYDLATARHNASELKNDFLFDVAISTGELYVQLYKNSPVPYLILTSDGKVKSANVAALRMLGVARTKVKGIDIFESLEGQEQSHLDFLFEKYKNGVAVSDEMVKIKRPDKREIWSLLSLFVFTDVGGKKIGLMTLVDITKQKKAEDAKSEFVSLASHQLRTPIAGMKWSAELLQMDNPKNLSDKQHKYIDRLLDSIGRMAVLVDDFLRVSRFELGTFQPEYETVSLSTLFEDILEEQASKLKAKKIKVDSFFDKDIDKIITDKNLLRMVITNLYTNAIKYTREGGTIHLGFGRKDSSIIISVTNNGMGIPISEQDAIFSKLYRASNASRNVPDGTGLGLYIVREAVGVLKGSVSFNSTEDMGSTFEVVLPLDIPKKEEEESK